MSSLPVESYVDSGKAAAFLGVSSKTLNDMARKGTIPAYVWGSGIERRTWRFKLSELDTWMKSRLNSAGRPPLLSRRQK
jgi:excisionase family DNA binding protein